MTAKFHRSQIIVDNRLIPNGVHRVAIAEWDAGALGIQDIEFINGQSVVPLMVEPGVNLLVQITSADLPPSKGLLFGIVSETNQITINNPTIPDGTHRVAVTFWDYTPESGVQLLTFIDGQAHYTANIFGDKEVVVQVTENVFPPRYGFLFSTKTDGKLSCFANEALKTSNGFVREKLFSIEDKTDIRSAVLLNSGAAVSLTSPGGFSYCSNGAYDYLDPGETVTQVIPVTTSLDTEGNNIYNGTFHDSTAFGYVYQSGHPDAWIAQADNWFTLNPQAINYSDESLRYIKPNLTIGERYVLNASYRDATTVGSKNGALEFILVDIEGDPIDTAINNGQDVTNRTGQAMIFDVPADYYAIRIRPRTDCYLDLKIDSINETTRAPQDTDTYSIEIKGSEQVSAKLVQPDALSGTNWTRNLSEYTFDAAPNVYQNDFYDTPAWGANYDPNHPDAWVAQADNWHTLNPQGVTFANESERYIRPLLTVGVEYEFRAAFRDSTTQGPRGGSLEFYLLDIAGNTIGSSALNSGQEVSGRTGFTMVFTVPANYHAIRIRPRTNCVLDLRLEYIRTTTNQPHPLVANIATTIGKIIEVQLKTKDATAGSVDVNGQHSTLLNDGDCWYFRATQENEIVNINPTSDFNGVVYDVFIREVITESYAAPIHTLELYDLEEAGKARVRWMIEPVALRISKRLTPTNAIKNNNDMTYDEFESHRWGGRGESVYFENVKYAGSRSGILSVDGGQWCELWNVDQKSGFNSTGITSEPLISRVDNIFSGTGWTYEGWGLYSKNGGTEPLRLDISGLGLVAGERVEVTMLYWQAERYDPIIGTVTPRIIGDTTVTGEAQATINNWEVLYFTVPNNPQWLEYVPSNDFNGKIFRLYLSRVLREITPNPNRTAQYQSGLGNANFAPNFNIRDTDVFYFDSDGFHTPPAVNNYDFINGDGIVLNRESEDANRRDQTQAIVVGSDIAWWGDACIDSKIDLTLNQSTLSYAHRNLRSHIGSQQVVMNTDFFRHGNTECALHVKSSTSFIVHNCYVDGVRCVSMNQMLNQKKVNPTAYVNEGAIKNNESNNLDLVKFHVSKTIPRIPKRAKLACTDMQFEYTAAGQDNWQPLALDNIGLPSPRGVTKREFTLTPGSYDIRARCLNAEHIGPWKTITNQVIT